MKVWSVLGIVIGFAALSVAILATAHEPLMFLNLPGLALVLIGTIAATMTSYSLRDVQAAFQALGQPAGSKDDPDHSGLQDIFRVAKSLNTEGAHEAENLVKRMKSPFLRTGLQLVIDGVPTTQLIDVLDWRIARLRSHSNAHADVFNVMAIYAPAFGMVGTLLGLVNMLRDLGGDIADIGANLSIALVTTFYGIVLANAVFKPIAVTLRRRTQDRVAVWSAAQEALVILADQHSHVQLKYSLSSFIDPDDPELLEIPLTRKMRGSSHG